MSYPSIITQPGSALRNLDPITEVLSELILPPSGGDADGAQSNQSESSRRSRRRILEIGSGDCTHLNHWANRWEEVEWWPTGRNESEVRTIDDVIEDLDPSLSNVRKGLQLDIGLEDSWAKWEREVRLSGGGVDHTSADLPADIEGIYQGVLMVNIIHCCPVKYPEQVFRHFSPRSTVDDKRPLLDHRTGWIAAYSPFLADDESYKSEGDEKFDREYIKAKDESLGLRTVRSVSDMAARWGFREAVRREMPRGNMWVVWVTDGVESVPVPHEPKER